MTTDTRSMSKAGQPTVQAIPRGATDKLHESRFSVAELSVAQRKSLTMKLGRYRGSLPYPALRVHVCVSVSRSFPCWSRGGTCREGVANFRQAVGRSSPSTRASPLCIRPRRGAILAKISMLTSNIPRVVSYTGSKAREVSWGNIAHLRRMQTVVLWLGRTYSIDMDFDDVEDVRSRSYGRCRTKRGSRDPEPSLAHCLVQVVYGHDMSHICTVGTTVSPSRRGSCQGVVLRGTEAVGDE
jgi:hypothetical protein